MTPPCSLAQRISGVVHVGQPLVFVPSEPGYVWSREVEQADVAERLRAEAADLDVVLEDA